MCIATVDPATFRPSARMVLLKELEADKVNGGFVFYTNYESRKSDELHKNPQVIGDVARIHVNGDGFGCYLIPVHCIGYN